MARLALAVVLSAAAGITAVVVHPKRPAPTGSDQLAPITTLPLPPRDDVRTSRGDHRLPLPPVKATSRRSGQGVSRPPLAGRARPAGRNGTLSDVTMYCATGNRNAAGRWPQLGDVAVIDRSIPFGTRVRIDGNVYTVEDWIGSGSQFDIFGGDDEGCEQRALDYGRRHLRVVVER